MDDGARPGLARVQQALLYGLFGAAQHGGRRVRLENFGEVHKGHCGRLHSALLPSLALPRGRGGGGGVGALLASALVAVAAGAGSLVSGAGAFRPASCTPRLCAKHACVPRLAVLVRAQGADGAAQGDHGVRLLPALLLVEEEEEHLHKLAVARLSQHPLAGAVGVRGPRGAAVLPVGEAGARVRRLVARRVQELANGHGVGVACKVRGAARVRPEQRIALPILPRQARALLGQALLAQLPAGVQALVELARVAVLAGATAGGAQVGLEGVLRGGVVLRLVLPHAPLLCVLVQLLVGAGGAAHRALRRHGAQGGRRAVRGAGAQGSLAVGHLRPAARGNAVGPLVDARLRRGEGEGGRAQGVSEGEDGEGIGPGALDALLGRAHTLKWHSAIRFSSSSSAMDCCPPSSLLGADSISCTGAVRLRERA